jgi:hypothetical protein
MNAPVSREFLMRKIATGGTSPSALEGRLRYVWESSFGPVVIEVIGDRIFVNGDHVQQIHRDDVLAARKA